VTPAQGEWSTAIDATAKTNSEAHTLIRHMKSTVEPLEGNKVKLSVEVEEAEFDRDIDAAFKKLAREIRLPGFRQGKAPRRILESRIGLAPARQQALQDSVPAYLAKAVRQNDIDLIDTPKIEVTSGEDNGPVVFDAECVVRPIVTVPGYGGLRIELPAAAATDDEIDKAVDAERKRHAKLIDTNELVVSGNHVTLDISATRDDEPVPGLNVEDWAYEVGQGWITDNFDTELFGASEGEVLTFAGIPKGTEESADFTVVVQRIQTLELPEVTDEWVGDHLGEFDTIAAWRESLRTSISAEKFQQARTQVVDKAMAALAELVDEEPPETLVTQNLQGRVQSFVRQLQSQGIDVERWLQITGQDAASFIEGFREQSARAVKVDLALRAVATAEGFEISDADLDREFLRIALSVNEKVGKVRQAYERNDAIAELSAQIRNNKALEWLLHHIEMVDEHGTLLDNDSILGHSHEEHDHDHEEHDHDHEGHDHDEDGAS
jgi:trigger factor